MKKLLFTLILSFLSQNTLADIYIVEFGKNISSYEKTKILKKVGISKWSPFSNMKNEYFDRLAIVDYESNDIKQLTQLKGINRVEADIEIKPFEIRINPQSEMITDDMLFPGVWGLYNQAPTVEGQTVGGAKYVYSGKRGVDIGWKEAIEDIEGKLKKTPVVAVIDMGIDFDHPELKDSIYYNEAECDENHNPKIPKKDHDGNGLPSDCKGWNFAATDVDAQQFPFDDKGHGTHISGIISAKRDNGVGISGVSDKIKILPIRVTGSVDESLEKNKLLIKSVGARIANGIFYAVKRKVDVINLSLGWPKAMDTSYMRRAINEALANDIVVVAAAGNDNTNANLFPCSYHDVICVGSVQADGKLSSFSNHGGGVDILAPGDQIMSTIPTSFIPLKLNIQGYDIQSGTSQAAPYVSAITALVKGLNPELTIDDVKYQIYKNASTSDRHKSIHGLIKMKSDLTPDSPMTLPIFKELNESKVNIKNGTFEFTFFVKNFGKIKDNIDKIEVQSEVSQIKIIRQNLTSVALEQGKPVGIRVLGQVSNLDVDREFKFKVKFHNQEFFHKINLGIDINTLASNTFGFKFKTGAKPIITFNEENKTYNDILNTVEEINSDGELPSYYIVSVKDKKLQMQTYHFDGKGFVESKTGFKDDGVVKFLGIQKYDFNYDGRKDYLISALKCLGESCESGEYKEEDLYISYFYRDINLEPLYVNLPELKLKNKNGVTINNSELAYRKYEISPGKFLALPVFVRNGLETNKDKVNSIVVPSVEYPLDDTELGELLLRQFLGKGRNRIEARIYLSTVNQDQLEIISLSSMEFKQQIKKLMYPELNLRVSYADSLVNIIGVLNQDKSDYEGNSIKILGSYGLGIYQYNFLVIIENGIYRFESMPDWTEPLLAATKYKLFSLNNKSQTSNTYVEFRTSNILNISKVFGDGHFDVIPYRLEDKNDIIVGFLGLFEDQSSSAFILEKIDSLSLFLQDNNKLKEYNSKTQKFSFLPGVVMSEVFYPITLMNRVNSTLVPGVYIDNTSISSDQIYVKTFSGGRFMAPLKNSLFLPDNCHSKNPAVNPDGLYYATALCLGENNDFQLRYFPLFK